MSTRSTLWYSDDFHLYREGFDEGSVYLEIRSQYFEELILKIPLAAWKEMRKQTIQPAESYLDLTDDELRAEAERQVEEHRAHLASLPESPLNSLSGILLFGSRETSKDEMTVRFLEHYRPRMADSGSSVRE